MWWENTSLLNDTISSLGKIKLVLSVHSNNSANCNEQTVRTSKRRHKIAAVNVLDVRDFWTENTITKTDIRNTNPIAM
jgi:hypothetical protein